MIGVDNSTTLPDQSRLAVSFGLFGWNTNLHIRQGRGYGTMVCMSRDTVMVESDDLYVYACVWHADQARADPLC